MEFDGKLMENDENWLKIDGKWWKIDGNWWKLMEIDGNWLKLMENWWKIDGNWLEIDWKLIGNWFEIDGIPINFHQFSSIRSIIFQSISNQFPSISINFFSSFPIDFQRFQIDFHRNWSTMLLLTEFGLYARFTLSIHSLLWHFPESELSQIFQLGLEPKKSQKVKMTKNVTFKNH